MDKIKGFHHIPIPREKKVGLRWDRIFILSLFIILLLCFITTTRSNPKTRTYDVFMNEDSRVYDGDTIQDVFIAVKTFDGILSEGEVLWPGLLLKGNSLFVVTDIRLAGIDTPEKRPRKAGRTAESLAAEKAASLAAQKALLKLVEAHNHEFTIVNPQLGKYAGRILADVHFGTGENRISASEYMIEQGHAKPYDGGKKPQWGF